MVCWFKGWSALLTYCSRRTEKRLWLSCWELRTPGVLIRLSSICSRYILAQALRVRTWGNSCGQCRNGAWHGRSIDLVRYLPRKDPLLQAVIDLRHSNRANLPLHSDALYTFIHFHCALPSIVHHFRYEFALTASVTLPSIALSSSPVKLSTLSFPYSANVVRNCSSCGLGFFAPTDRISSTSWVQCPMLL